MTEPGAALQAFLDSLDSDDRHFAEAFDESSARRLAGGERDGAIALLVARLARGADRRVPRCLAAMGAVEALGPLRIAAASAQPSVRVESAVAHDALDPEAPPLLCATAEAVLQWGTAGAHHLAVASLARAGEREVLRGVVLSRVSAGVRGRALAAWLPRPLVRYSAADGLEQRVTAGPLALALGAREDLDALEADPDPWYRVADVSRPPFPSLRVRLSEGRPEGLLPPVEAADLEGLGEPERALLRGWAAWKLGAGHANGPSLVVALEVPGAWEALEELRGSAEGDFRAAIDAVWGM